MAEKKLILNLEAIGEDGVALLSGRGSVTIPSELRKELGLKTNSACGYIQVNISSENKEYNGAKGILIYPVEVRPRTKS